MIATTYLLVIGVVAGLAALVLLGPEAVASSLTRSVVTATGTNPGEAAVGLAHLRAESHGLPLLLLPLTLAALGLRWAWTRRPDWRAAGLVACWATLAAMWLGAFRLGFALEGDRSAPQLLARIRAETGLAHPRLVTYGYEDDALTFYNDAPAPEVTAGELRRLADAAPSDLVVTAPLPEWRTLERRRPELAARFAIVDEWQGWSSTSPKLILRLASGTESRRRTGNTRSAGFNETAPAEAEG